jgi:hypothetical protein
MSHERMGTAQQHSLRAVILFKIDASRCDLRVGDAVMPETIIGEDFETHARVRAGCCGRVKGISFDPMDHALLVMIEVDACAVAAAPQRPSSRLEVRPRT